jgi:putative ABC transport system substrate-binding protein
LGFVRGLREQGYVEGQNLTIEYRWTTGTNEFAGLAAELVRLKVDVIVAHASPAVRAAKQATATIPIVLLNVADPVGEGLVASLARPGGNVTGVSNQSADFMGKLLELSKEAIPELVRVAVIAPPTPETGAFGPVTRARIKELETAASVLGVTVHSYLMRDSVDVSKVFAQLVEQKAHAVVVLPDWVTWFHRVQILDLSTRSRIPSVCIFKLWAQAGCLIAYGPSLPDLFYRAGVLTGKLLKGARPADLPVEQPTKFELVINLKTAKALGLTIPQTLLLRADQVIE